MAEHKDVASDILRALVAMKEFRGQYDPDNYDRVNKRGPVPIEKSARSFYGATFLFDAVGDKLGIAAKKVTGTLIREFRW